MSRVERHAAEEQATADKRAERSVAEEETTAKVGFGRKVIGGLLSLIGTLIIIAVIAVALALTVPRFAGISSYVVLSGSMEPAVPVGSLVYSSEVEPATLETGDIIVYGDGKSGGIPVTHRVVENRIADGEVVTKGDANEQEDLSPVPYSNVLGKVVLHLPVLGRIASPFATMAGKIAAAMIVIAGFLLGEAGSRIRRRR